MISNEVILIVLLAAALNAGWNSAIKVGGDRLTVMAITTLVGSAISLGVLPWVRMPESASWMLLALSIAIHTLYHVVLPVAYSHGDLGQIYPIARGSAPLLVMAGAALFAGERPEAGEMLGVVVLSVGVLALALRDPASGSKHGGTNGKAVGYALLTGLLIAAYTVVDALGARRSGSAIGFAVLITLGDGIATALLLLCWKGVKVFRLNLRSLALGAMAGAMQMGSYWIAVWALARAPMGTVSALRETSVLFVALISAFVLKEGVTMRRLVSAGLVCVGIGLIRFGAG